MEHMHPKDPGPHVAADLTMLAQEARWLASVAGRLLGNSALAEDACQDTWLKTHRDSKGVVPSRRDLVTSLRGFVSVARRGERRRRHRERAAARKEGLPSADEWIARDEQLGRMWDAVAGLDEPLRTTLVMHYRHEATTTEIAERLGVAKDTVRWRLRKGVAELRSKLDRDRAGGGLAALAVLVRKDMFTAAAITGGGAGLAAASVSLPKLTLAIATVVVASVLLWAQVLEPRTLRLETGAGEGPLETAVLSPVTQDTPADEEATAAIAPAPAASGNTDRGASTRAPVALLRWTLLAVDQAGHPIPDAEVFMAHRARNEVIRRSLGVTGQDGRYSVERLPEQALSLWIERAGYQNGFVDLQSRNHGERDLGAVLMLPATPLFARVVDDGGRGVPGAIIYAERPKELEGMWTLPPGREDWCVTDKDGFVNWPNLSPSTRRFLIHSERLQDRIVTWNLDAEGRSLASPALWQLKQGATLQGRVVGIPEEEEGGRRFRVAAHLMGSAFGRSEYLGGPATEFFSRCPWSVVEVDGSFTLYGLHPGANYRIGMAEMRGGEPDGRRSHGVRDADSLCEPKDVLANAGSVELQWRKEASLSFRIAVEGGGKPPANVRLASGHPVLVAAISRHGTVELDASGRCTIAIPPTGSGMCAFSVGCQGYLPASVSFDPLRPGDTVDLGTLSLRPSPRCSVRVTDAETGEAVEGAVVYSSADERSARLAVRPATARTDTVGLARVEFLESATHSLSVRHPEFAERVLAAQSLKGQGVLEVALSRGGQAIVLADRAEEGQRVLCKPVTGDAALGASIRRTNNLQDLRIVSKETDEIGRVTFDHMPTGEYEFFQLDSELNVRQLLQLMASDQRPGSVRGVVSEGASLTVDLGEAPLVVLEGTLTLDGSPLRGAKVSLFDPVAQAGESVRVLQQSFRLPVAESAPDGGYRLELTSGGSFMLLVQSDRCAVVQEEPIALKSGVQRLDLDLTRCVVEGRVVDSNGTPVADQMVLVYRPRPRDDPLLYVYSDHYVRTGSDGRFRLVGLPPGVDFSVQSHARGWQGTSFGPFRMQADSIRDDVLLVTERAANLTVTVGRAAPHPTNFTVVLRLVEPLEGRGSLSKSSSFRRVLRLESGTRSLTAEALTPGRYVVEWKDGEDVIATSEVDVLLDVVNRLEIAE